MCFGERGWGRSEVEDEGEKVNRGREQYLHYTVEETASGRKRWLSLTSVELFLPLGPAANLLSPGEAKRQAGGWWKQLKSEQAGGFIMG